MFERNLILKYLSVKDNFLYVNTNLKFLKTGTCVRLIDCENNVFYFSIGNYSTELEDNCIGISSLLAKTLDIEDNVLFRLSELSPFSSVASIIIFPVIQTDYEVLHMLSQTVQETLLHQIRVVYSGQKFIIWVGNNISVRVCVGETNPVSPGAIDFLTEVQIEPIVNFPDSSSLSKAISNTFSFENWSLFYNSSDEKVKCNPLRQYLKTCSELIFRIIPLNKLPLKSDFLTQTQPFIIFLSKNQCTNDFLDKYFSTRIFSISLLTNDIFGKDMYVKLSFFEEIEDFGIEFNKDLYVNQELFDLFECELGARVILKNIYKYPIVNEIQVNSKKNYSVDVIETFKNYLAKGSDDVFVLNSNVATEIGENVICNFNFFPNDPKFCVVDDKLVRNCKYVLNIENVFKEIKRKVENMDELFIKEISNYEELLNSVIKIFTVAFNQMENVLVTGKPGTGKSTLLKKIAYSLQNYPHFTYTKHVNCKSIKGKTMDSLVKFFSTTFSELLLHQPSVLILDDLHVLCENVQGEEAAPNNIYFSRISEMLHNFLKLFSSLTKIGILASAESVQKLNKYIYSSRGSHLLKNVYIIRDLAKSDRILALKVLFKEYHLENVNFNDISIKTEGFVIQDLIDFANKTIFEMYKQECSSQKSMVVKQVFLERALKNTSILSLQNVQLHSPGEKNFSDIGGLHNVKEILVENLLWPGLYPNIFGSAPLRLQSGILLYGPPGCGKTLLAAAAAKQCDLRLISVKGPELLSKYIGASEQAVRDIFQKAQSAKPCILFFDEFDSLAPKRGHDNTGVTDRVVNQILTQLDGVESLIGVCILAATSRPDLLDSALLRPGRLDKQLLCSLPNTEERKEILTLLCKNLNLGTADVLDEIAKKTEHFSGADLQSLLYTAHLLTVDYSSESDKVLSQDCIITKKHLDEAFRKTKPSLSSKERLKYDRIYRKFQAGSTLEDFKTGSRATLA